MKHYTHKLEFLGILCLERLLSLPPRGVALHLGGVLGLALYWGGYRRSVVRANMTLVGMGSPAQIERISKELYVNLGRYLADFLRPHPIPPPHNAPDMEVLQRLLTRKKGIVAIMAHFGGWEIFAHIFDTDTIPLAVVAKNMHNPYVDRWLEKKRLRTGVSIIYKDKAMRKIITVLKQNGMVAMLIDQFIRGHGTPVPFMGQMVETIRTAAGVLYKFDCSAIYAYSILQPDNSYRTVIKEAPAPELDNCDEEAALAAYLKEHNAELERWIRANPSHWFGWLHRRFKGVINYH